MAEVVGVRMIDFRQVGDGKIGPIAQAIFESYKETVRGREIRSEEWLEYLPIHQASDQEKVLIYF